MGKSNLFVNNTPVLLIIFNRPYTTQLVFDEIKKAKPKKLYVAADGPRFGNKADETNCKLTRDIIQQVDWDCDLQTRFLDNNVGCGPGPSSAISWVFEQEDRAIILEDDCVPVQPFFSYCDQLLEKYKDDSRIWLVSGNNYSEEFQVNDYSYFFSLYGHSWGWATWKRCWNHFNLEIKNWPAFRENKRMFDVFPTKKEATFFHKIFDRIYNDKTTLSHIWDFQFGFSIRSNGGLCIVPRKNLVKNIGYLGTHSEIKNDFHDRDTDDLFEIVKHPRFVLVSGDYDRHHFKHHWMKMGRKSFLKRVIKKLVK